MIARIFRGAKYQRRMVVSAEGSRDLNRMPLKFHWSILRGDPARVKINYLNSMRSQAEITFSYHPRAPIGLGARMESNRVDIGVFVHNGAYYSAPSFITSFTLDNEAREYRSDGQPLEIAYGTGAASAEIKDWNAFFGLFGTDSESLQSRILKKHLSVREIEALKRAGEEYLKAADGKEGERTKRILEKKIRDAEISPSGLAQKALDAMLNDPNLWSEHADQLAGLCRSADLPVRQAFSRAIDRMVAFGFAEKTGDLSFSLKPLRAGSAPIKERLTAFESSLIQSLNAVISGRILFPGIVEANWKENYVDARLTSDKEWRDIYIYSQDGKLQGWRRYGLDGIREFTADGLLVLEKDSSGRCRRARVVRYEAERPKPRSLRKTIKMVPTETIREF